ncbi:MAG TPA: hypothetical protein VFJ64_10490 [Solirubrobacterales bacterium]|nr:hypothetical protein [Solirubrobacterales bacterium]
MLNTPHWQRAGARPEPFVAGEKSRPLQLIVCDDELGSSPALGLLSSFAARRGPLAFVSPSGAVGGRIKIAFDQSEIEYSFKGGRETCVFVYGDWWKRLGPEEAARAGVDASTLERRFLLAHEASTRDWIDGLVMPFDEVLRDRWKNLLSKAGLMTAESAAALMGLYLRACGERMIEIEPPGVGIMVSEERMYLLGALAFLPRYEMLHEAAGEIWRQSGDPTLAGLADAIAVRLGRALKARDYMHMRRRAPNVREIWSDVLYFFESLLVCLQGALDAAARFVHELFELKGPCKRANWGREDWWRQLERSKAPAGEFDRGCFKDLDLLVGELRNSIHGEVLTSELRQRVRPGETPKLMGYSQLAVALESEVAVAVSAAAKRRRGLGRWSIRPTLPDGAALVDPWHYSEAAIVTVADALSSVIEALASHVFSDVVLNPKAQELWLGREAQRANAGILFGLEHLPAP